MLSLLPVKEKWLLKHIAEPNLNKTWYLEKFDCLFQKGEYYVHSEVKGKDNWGDAAAGQDTRRSGYFFFLLPSKQKEAANAHKTLLSALFQMGSCFLNELEKN